jgi:spore coat protein U-like protein
VTVARSAWVAVLAILLIATLPVAGAEEQYPRGLMSATPPDSNSSCIIETRPLSFGTYDPLVPTDLDAVGQVIYNCTSGSSALASDKLKIRIDMDTGFSSMYSERGMTGPGFEMLRYNIYLDANRRKIWGNGTNGTDNYIDNNAPSSTPVIVPAYGRIWAMQDVPGGPYQDIVQVRITF